MCIRILQDLVKLLISVPSTILSIIRNVTIEPIFFLFSLCLGFYIIVASELYISKVCNVNLNYTRDICDNIVEHKEEQVEVQKYVSSLQVKNDVIQAIPACVYVLFAGPWSDRYGRKFLICCCLFGYVVANGVFLINLYFFYELKAEYLLFEALQDLTGGKYVFYMASYSYISDVSDPKMRTKRFAFLDGVFPIGFNLGTFFGGIIKKKLGFYYNFGFGMLCATLAILYCIFFVKDSRIARDERTRNEQALEMKSFSSSEQNVKVEPIDEEDENKNKGNVIRELFSLKNLKEGFASLAKKRDHNRRTFLILLVLAFEIEMFAQNGVWTSRFLFLRRVLNWTSLEYSYYSTCLGMIGLFAQWVAVPVMANVFKLHDSTVSLLDSITSVFNLCMLAFVKYQWMLYLGCFVAFLDGTTTTVFRSLISKNVENDEIGKIFSVVGIFQALLPFASGPIFRNLYKATVESQPNAYLFLIIGIKFLLFMVVFGVNRGMLKEEGKYKKQKEKLDIGNNKDEAEQLQTKLISENKDNLLSHHTMAAKSLANKVSNDESSEDGTKKMYPNLH